MTEMDELKPCPFCGYAPTGEEELLDILDVDEFGEKVEKIKYVGVSCAGCYAYVPVQTHDKTEAIAAWNRRPSISPAGVTEEQVEAAARVMAEGLYEGREGWVEYQAIARSALEAAAKAQPSISTGQGEAAAALETLQRERDEAVRKADYLSSGINAIVNLQSPLTRAQVREAMADLLTGAGIATRPTGDQSPFVTRALTAERERDEVREALREAEPYVETLHSLVAARDARMQVMAVIRKMRAAARPHNQGEGK